MNDLGPAAEYRPERARCINERLGEFRLSLDVPPSGYLAGGCQSVLGNTMALGGTGIKSRAAQIRKKRRCSCISLIKKLPIFSVARSGLARDNPAGSGLGGTVGSFE